MTIILYDSPVSTYCQQVRIALREKGLDFRIVSPAGLGTGQQPDADWQAANVRVEVPTLIDGEDKVFDSTIILEYLEDKYPDTAPLLPSTPAKRARARTIEDVVQTTLEAIHWGYSEVVWAKRAEGQVADHLKQQAREQAAEVRKWLEEQLGEQRFFGGDTFGWADVAVGPALHRGYFYEDGMAPAQGSKLDRWHDRILQRPSVQKTLAEMEAGARVTASRASAVFAAGTGNRRQYRDHRLEWLIKSGGIQVVQDGLRDGTIRFAWPPAKAKSQGELRDPA